MKRLLRRTAVAVTVAAAAIGGLALPASADGGSAAQAEFCDYRTTNMDFYIVGNNQNVVWTTSPTNEVNWGGNNCFYLANWWWQIGDTVEVHWKLVGKGHPWHMYLWYLDSSYEDGGYLGTGVQ